MGKGGLLVDRDQVLHRFFTAMIDRQEELEEYELSVRIRPFHQPDH